MNATLDQLPVAWLGYAPHFEAFTCVRICAWCPDKKEADKLAKDAGLKVSHTCCEKCAGEQLRLALGL